MAQTVILGEKVGMTQKWVDDKVVPVTVLRVEPMRIVQIKTTERDGYTALHPYPHIIQLLSHPGRVGVYGLSYQQFISDGDDAGFYLFHAYWFKMIRDKISDSGRNAECKTPNA